MAYDHTGYYQDDQGRWMKGTAPKAPTGGGTAVAQEDWATAWTNKNKGKTQAEVAGDPSNSFTGNAGHESWLLGDHNTWYDPTDVTTGQGRLQSAGPVQPPALAGLQSAITQAPTGFAPGGQPAAPPTAPTAPPAPIGGSFDATPAPTAPAPQAPAAAPMGQLAAKPARTKSSLAGLKRATRRAY